MNVSLAMKKDPETDKAFGWVLEMYVMLFHLLCMVLVISCTRTSCFRVFSYMAESESTCLQFGLDLLHAMKEELGLTPSRKCPDFLLHACVSAKDLQSSLFVWQKYQAAGLPYNTLSFF